LRSVEVYDPNLDSWKQISPMNVKRSRVALTSNMGKLYAIGGYDGESNLSTVEVYDPKNDSWSFVSSMLYHGGNFMLRNINKHEINSTTSLGGVGAAVLSFN
jgi:kelch-like protein 18